MKFYKYIFSFLAFTLLSCERDDICALGTSTTPRLLIDFFNVADVDVPKTAIRLTVYADDPNITVPDDEDFSGAILVEPFELDRVYNINSASVSLPLLIEPENETTTLRYFFERDTNLRLDDNPATNSNIDILQLTYKSEDVYVSRACGFKSIFNAFEIEILPGDDGIAWMTNFTFSEDIINEATNTPTVENEDTTHVQIFH